MDIEFAAEVAESGWSPPGRHLVLDPESLVERFGAAVAEQAVMPYDGRSLIAFLSGRSAAQRYGCAASEPRLLSDESS